MTSITLVGRLTGDPELRFTPAGAPVANFTVAENHRRKQGDEWIDDGTTFYRCAAWKGLAENVAGSLTKGQLVILAGSLRTREYDRADGSKGLSLDVTVTDIGPALSRATQGQTAPAASAWSQPAQQPQGGASWGSQEAPF